MEDINLFRNRILIAASYIFWLPAFYIILTEKRKNKLFALHSAQAMFLWVLIISISIVLKLLVFIPFFYIIYDILTFVMWLYCIYCAVMFMADKDFDIPLISDISRKLI